MNLLVISAIKILTGFYLAKSHHKISNMNYVRLLDVIKYANLH